MILYSLLGTIKQYWASIYDRQWANWELLLIAAGAAALLIMVVIAWRRLEETDQKPGTERMTAGQSDVTDDQSIQLLQHEIIKRDHTAARLQGQISELTAANKQLRQEIAEGNKAIERSKQKIAELTAANEQLKGKIAELTRAAEQLSHGVTEESSQQRATELTDVNIQLQQKVTQGNKTIERFQQEIARLTAANRQFEDGIAKLTGANEQLRQRAAASQKAWERANLKIAELTALNEQLRRGTRQVVKEVPQREGTGQTTGGEEPRQKAPQTDTAARSPERRIAEPVSADELFEDEVPEYRKAASTETSKRHKTGGSGFKKVAPLSEINVKTKSPSQQLKELAEEVLDSKSAQGKSDGPDAKREAIKQACDYLDAGNNPRAIEALKRFVHAVASQRPGEGGIVQKEEAEDLIAGASEIIDQLRVEQPPSD